MDSCQRRTPMCAFHCVVWSRRFVASLLCVASLWLGGCGGGGGGGGGGTPVPPASAQLVSLDLSIAPDSVVPGGLAFANVVGRFDDGSVVNVTATVDWIIDDPSLATVQRNGTLNALAPGIVSVSAQMDAVVSNAVDVVIATPPTGSVVRMNAAGGEVTLDGDTYVADSDFSPVTPGFQGGDAFTVGAPIGNTNEAVLYQSVRFGDFAFRVPGIQGNVGVRLHFVEPFFQQSGQRVFRLSMEGAELESQLDLAMSVGAFNAHVRDYNVVVDDGVLDIEFEGIVDNAVLAGVEVTSDNVTMNTLVSLAVDPTTLQLDTGDDATATATGEFDDGSTQDLTAAVDWMSSDSSVVSVLSPGVLRGGQPGTATVTASLSGLSAQVEVTVEPSGQTRQGMQWYPPTEWSWTNPSWSGSPHDVVAIATFTHTQSGEVRQTPLFFDGENSVGEGVWRVRFCGSLPGTWSFVTTSTDADLTGHTGNVVITASNSPGFVRSVGTKWVREGNGKAFVPQYAMYAGPHYYASDPTLIDQAIETFLVQHGFNGFHVPVYMRWFDIERDDASGLTNFDPDLDTFRALEQLIRRTYEAGGTVHLWQWGDEQASQTPDSLPGGYGGTEDVRLLRTIAARLAPLPGWTMGYGFDCYEYATEAMLHEWRDTLNDLSGWDHFVSARNGRFDITAQLATELDYSSYENIQPEYDDSSFHIGFGYLQTLANVPDRPTLSEDRFRLRDPSPFPWKDYTEEMTRRGLWHSAMAGGCGNIWGNLVGAVGANDGVTPSAPYPNPQWSRTYALFMNDRFSVDMEPAPTLTDGVCLQRTAGTGHLFYKEDTSSIVLDLSGLTAPVTGVAVDALAPYAEIPLGSLDPGVQVWTAPYPSDWAIAVGEFD